MTSYSESIPFLSLGGALHTPRLHFLHANGYPPEAYRPLLERLAANYAVMAMRMRPQWPDYLPEADPAALSDWLPFADDLERFLETQAAAPVVGVGHSVGAVTTLRLALRRPELFSALALIDPVFFPPWTITAWGLFYHLGLAYRLHPLVKSALRRRSAFDSRQAMFDNYRKKAIFSRLSDEGLWAYVDSLACPGPDGRVQLCYTPAWEARIYATGVYRDLPLWRALPRLRLPLLVLRGADSDTFWETTARRLQRLLPAAQVVTLPAATHLLPLEKPGETAAAILQFLDRQPGGDAS